jgi:CrcB protein
MILLMASLGAALGAPARYLTDRVIQSRHAGVFPWGTLIVNVVGSLILGLLLGIARNHDVPSEVLAGVGTGFCGALTTYSTFGFETIRLVEDGARLYALLNVLFSVIVGLVAAGLVTPSDRLFSCPSLRGPG